MPEKFESLSVLLPVINETSLLRQTVDSLMSDNAADIFEILIVVCDKTKPDSLETCAQLKLKYGEIIQVFKQTLPFLGGAMRDSFARARGSHLIMMASDLETPPEKVKEFIKESKLCPKKIITGSRWIKGGGFEGYSFLKFALNYIFQKIFQLMYWTNLTDMTYGYRLFPTALVQSIKWEELRHPFLFETIVKPLRLGVEVIEVPTPWKARDEGESQNTFWRNFEYFRIGIKTRLYSKQRVIPA
ncbi:MAG: glycosyltransferase family 2 protein [bacterium]